MKIKMEASGICIELPFNIGDILYKKEKGVFVKLQVESLHCWSNGIWVVKTHTDKKNKYWKGYEITLQEIGNKVYLQSQYDKLIDELGEDDDWDV